MLAGTTAATHPEFEGTGHTEQPSAVQACMAVYPATDIRLTRGIDRVSVGLSKHVREMVMPAGHTQRDLENFSPIVHANADFPPTCFFHGNADNIVSPMDSLKMYKELHQLGAHAELHMIAHAPHSISRDPLLGASINHTMITFFDRLFRPETTGFRLDAQAQAGMVEKGAVEAAQAALEANATAQLEAMKRPSSPRGRL
jgi:hypothetical protein